MNFHSHSVACRLFVCASLIAGTAAPRAAAQLAPRDPAKPVNGALQAIKTWAVRGEPGQVVYTSPAKAGTASMTLILSLVQPLGGKSLDDHFKTVTSAHVTRVAAGQAIHKRQGVMSAQLPTGRLLTETVVLKSANGNKGGEVIVLTSWQASGGAQVTVQLIPEQMADDDPSVKQSNDYVAVLSGLGFELTTDKLEKQTKNNR
jgi:hypothetical protein